MQNHSAFLLNSNPPTYSQVTDKSQKRDRVRFGSRRAFMRPRNTSKKLNEKENQAMARIKAKKSFKTLKVPGALTRGRAVLDGMFNKDNPNYTVPPPAVDAPTFKNSLDELAVRYSEALDGGKKAKEALKK